MGLGSRLCYCEPCHVCQRGFFATFAAFAVKNPDRKGRKGPKCAVAIGWLGGAGLSSSINESIDRQIE